MPDNTIIEPGVAKAFEDVMERGRVLFSVPPAASEKARWPLPCWQGGKFCARARTRLIVSLSAISDDSRDILLLDELQMLREEELP